MKQYFNGFEQRIARQRLVNTVQQATIEQRVLQLVSRQRLGKNTSAQVQ
jgi:hypothetical protein